MDEGGRCYASDLGPTVKRRVSMKVGQGRDVVSARKSNCGGSDILHVVQVFQMEDGNIVRGAISFHSSASSAFRVAQDSTRSFPAVMAWSRARNGPPVALFEFGPIPPEFQPPAITPRN
jgi:hypothetical protein